MQEYCQQNLIPLPEYKEFPADGGFYCTVTVGGKQYKGVIKGKIKDAKHSAAEVALQQLDSLSKSNSTLVTTEKHTASSFLQAWLIVVQIQVHL